MYIPRICIEYNSYFKVNVGSKTQVNLTHDSYQQTSSPYLQITFRLINRWLLIQVSRTFVSITLTVSMMFTVVVTISRGYTVDLFPWMFQLCSLNLHWCNVEWCCTGPSYSSRTGVRAERTEWVKSIAILENVSEFLSESTLLEWLSELNQCTMCSAQKVKLSVNTDDTHFVQLDTKGYKKKIFVSFYFNGFVCPPEVWYATKMELRMGINTVSIIMYWMQFISKLFIISFLILLRCGCFFFLIKCIFI